MHMFSKYSARVARGELSLVDFRNLKKVVFFFFPSQFSHTASIPLPVQSIHTEEEIKSTQPSGKLFVKHIL